MMDIPEPQRDAFFAALGDKYRYKGVLGRSAMAVVYLAEDTKHGRRVAIKALDPVLAETVGTERFLNEIRTTAALQHPRIVSLLESGEARGMPYYVMPFIEGETLRSRLTRESQLPVSEATRIAREVAEALDYSHRHGLVHRDVKPENILLHDGGVFVTDFGIAFAITSAGGQRLTGTGISIGSPQYMAPEQAAAERAIDARADIFALGAVTYEMLAGEPPFSGPNIQAVLTRIATEDPRPLSVQRPSVPLEVEAAVSRALQKVPADRFATVKEFADALASDVDRPRAAAPRRKERSRAPGPMLAVAAIAGLAAIVAAWLVGRRVGKEAEAVYPPSRLAIVSPGVGSGAGAALQRQIALTPDGATLLYAMATTGGQTRLMRQSLSAGEPTPIADVREGIAAPLVSADGRSFLGWASGERQEFRYPIDGGIGQPVSFPGGTTDFAFWDARGTIWFSPRDGGGLFRLDAGDSAARAIAHSADVRLQQVLPDGRHALVMTRATAASGPIEVLDIETGERKPLLSTAVEEARYADGHLIWVLPDGSLDAQPFDLDARRLTGTAVTLGTGVAITGVGVAQFAVAPNGTIAYIVEEPPQLVFVDRAGAVRVVLDGHNYHAPKFSPDGKRVAVDFTTADGRDVWIYTLRDSSLARATFAHDAHDATWTPDGAYITYLSERTGIDGIYRKRPDNTTMGDLLFASTSIGYTGVWLNDGSGILTTVHDIHPGSGADIVIIRNGGRGPLEDVAATEFKEAFPAASPDAHWAAYSSDRSGRPEIYVRALGRPGDEIQISQHGGTEPAWDPAGNALFYRTLADSAPEMMMASLHIDTTVEVVSRRPLFPVSDMIGTNPHTNYDISPDGKAFVMMRRTPEKRIMVVQGLRELVRQLEGRGATR